MLEWIMAHGGYMGIVLAFNVLMSAVQSVFNALKLQEPGWLQKIGSIGAQIISWLSANRPSVDLPKPPIS